MPTKILGQISAFIKSVNPPSNTGIIWVDTSTSPFVHKIYDGTGWIPVAGDALGMLRLNSEDTPGYLEDKLHDSLTVLGGELKVTIPVTNEEKQIWDNKIKTYFVNSSTERDAIEANDGDEAFFPKENTPSKMEGWKYRVPNEGNPYWFKFSDEGWENLGSILWENIFEADENVERVIDTLIGFGQESGKKLMSSKQFGFIDNGEALIDPNTGVLDLLSNGEMAFFTVNAPASYKLKYITLNGAQFPNGKFLKLQIKASEPYTGNATLWYDSSINKGIKVIGNRVRGVVNNGTIYSRTFNIDESVTIYKVADDLWHVYDIADNKLDAYNKSFGRYVGQILEIGETLALNKHFKLDELGKVVSSNVIIDKGDNPYDYGISTFTKDGDFHMLDLSGKLPEGTSFVLFRLSFTGNTVGGLVGFKNNANTTTFGADTNESLNNVLVANTQHYADCWVAVDEDRKIKYRVSSTITSITLTIGGWV